VLAVDTNVIVRYLTRDDAEQFARTNAIIGRAGVYICTTVLLETEWVLRRGYGLSRDRVVQALAAVAALPHVTLEDDALLATALGWAARGMDFADALHLAKSAHCDTFISFDRRLASAALAIPGVVVRAP
jgi:predicted nucleic-acid-binding protein